MESNGTDTVIRPLRPQDQDTARRLILAGMAEHWGAIDATCNPDLKDIVANYAGATFLLAWQGDALVGTGALIHEAEVVARVVRMSVARAMRRRGIGRLILQHLLERARAAGYCQVVLETTSTWAEAIAFYLQQGFRIVEVRDGETHMALDLETEIRPG